MASPSFFKCEKIVDLLLFTLIQETREKIHGKLEVKPDAVPFFVDRAEGQKKQKLTKAEMREWKTYYVSFAHFSIDNSW